MITTPRYRIGNDMTILWAINNKDGSPFDMSGKEVRLFMTHRYGREEVNCSVVTLPDGTVNNVIRWDFSGDVQKVLGPYAITARIFTSDDMKLIRKDICEAFELVAVSCLECEEEGDAVINDGGELILSSKLDIYRFGIPKIYIGDNGNWYIDGVDTGRSALGGGPGLVTKIYNKSDFGAVFSEDSVIDTFNAHAINDLAERLAHLESDDYFRLHNLTDVLFQGDLVNRDILLFDGTYWTNVPLGEILAGVGGIDEAGLEEYLTENGYATQGWVTSQGFAKSKDLEDKVDKAYVDTVKAELDAIVGGDATDAIESINEILAFLSTMADSDTLAGIVANLKKMIQEGDDGNIRYTDDAIAALKQYLDNADNDLDEKIGNLAERVDDLESSKAVIFDATSSTDPWNLNVLQTSTTIEKMTEAINNGSPIYMRFGSGLVAVANAELYKNGDVSLYVHLVDSESELIRTIHAYSTTDGGWAWESFDNPLGGGGSATPRVEMTASSAVLQPNTFHVWPIVDALDLTLGAEQSGVMNRYLFQFRNPKDSLTMLTLPDDITWSEDTDLDENGMPVMEATAFYRIEIIEGLASLKKWKLAYIVFADAEVERVLMANGIGDGSGITKRDAAAVVSFGRWFHENKNVVSFEELKYFTNVKELYEESFWHCESLSLDMTGKLKSVEYIGNGSFSNTKAKGAVAFPNLKQVFGIWQNEGLFMNTDIEEVLDLGSVQSLIEGYNENYPGCFGKCTKLRKVVLPDTYRTIGPYEFYGCTSLTELMGLGGVNFIGQCAFSGCSSLNVDLTGMLGNVEKLATGAFANTKAKGSLSMPNLKQHIGSVWANATFLNTDIEEVLDLGSVASFVDGYNGNYPGCFGKCTKLRKVVLPNTLTATGAFTFYGCSALESVICHAVTPPTLGASCFDATNGTFVIYVPDASVEAYKAATGWNNFAMRIHPMSDYGLLPDIPGPGGYVQDSMLMWLDGIDKGSIPDVWSDLMGNSQFVNNGATVLSNGYEFDGSAYMTGINAETYSWAGRTFEIVVEFAGNSGTELVYMSNGGISFGRTSSQIIVASGSNAGAYADIYPNFGAGKMVFARQENLGAVINGILTSSNGDNYFDGSGVFLGKRSSGSYFKGKIHAIRIHNRLLTQEEILQNQRLDNERFGLGLDI